MVDYTNLFFPYGFEKNVNIILNYLNMDEINKINLSEQTKFRLDEISKIENYFIEEINQRKSCSKKLNKYVTTFDYIDKISFKCSK